MIQVTFKMTTGFGSVLMTRAFDQTDNQVMNSRQDPSSSADCHAGIVFVESDISTVVQARFYQPMCTSDLEHFCRRGLIPGKAGQAELGFTAGFVDFPLPDPGKLSFEPIDLANFRPVKVIVEHGTGLHGAFFKSPMSIIGFADCQEVGLDLSEAGFGVLCKAVPYVKQTGFSR